MNFSKPLGLHVNQLEVNLSENYAIALTRK